MKTSVIPDFGGCQKWGHAVTAKFIAGLVHQMLVFPVAVASRSVGFA